MNSVIKLAKIGCGNAMIQSCIDRGNIQAAISNANTFLKYYKYAVKSGIYTTEQAAEAIQPYYNKLLSIEHLANLYHELWKENFYSIKLQIEKFITPPNTIKEAEQQ
jgi:hypothetical protein